MAATFHFGNHIEQLIVLQKLIVDFGAHGLDALDGLGGHPNDGLLHHPVTIGLVELDGGSPNLDEPGIGALASLLQTGEVLPVTIGEPELACHQTVGILGLGQVLIHLLGVEIQGIHMIHWKLAVHSGGILSHGVIHTGGQLLPIGPEFHLATEGVDVDGKRLADDFIHTGFLELFLKVFPRLVGTVSGIAATLVLGGTQLLDNLLVMRQILGIQLHGGESQ